MVRCSSVMIIPMGSVASWYIMMSEQLFDNNEAIVFVVVVFRSFSLIFLFVLYLVGFYGERFE